MNLELIRKYTSDIRFWIILAFIVRIYGIWQPPLEVQHNWRQVTGNMVARNFLETDNNIMFPRLDFAGEKTGITGTEFPVMNYLIYLFSVVFGWQHWYGRLINLIISSIGIWFFYKSVIRITSKEQAFFASFILLLSIWFIYSRKSMPDTFSASLCIAGLWYGTEYIYKGKFLSLFLFFILSLAGVLSKIPSLVLLTPLLLILLKKDTPLNRKIIITSTGILIIIPVYLWYFVQVPCLNETYEFSHYYFGTSLLQGYCELGFNVPGTLEMFYFVPLMYTGFVFFLAGVFFMIKNKKMVLLYVLLASSLFWFVFMLKSGRNFWVHSYYITPFVPFMALAASEFLHTFRYKTIIPVIMLIFAAESLANQQHDFKIHDSDKYRLKLESLADKFIPAGSLTIINGGENPRDIYFLNRKGWSVSNDGVNKYMLRDLEKKGAKYLVVDMNYLSEIPETGDSKLLYSDSDYRIYQLVNR